MREKRLNASIQIAVLAILIAIFVSALLMLAHWLFREKESDIPVGDFYDLTIVIDAGHGGEDGGTSSSEGLLEKDLNLIVAKKLQSLFEAAGINTVMTRSEDKLLYDPLSDYMGRKKILDMRERVRIANESENPIFISIHMNAFPEEKYSGLQVYYSQNDEASLGLAESVQTNICKYLQTDNTRKIKSGKDIFLLDRLSMPCILVECGFLSNPEEAELLADDEYRDELAFWIFYSVLDEIH